MFHNNSNLTFVFFGMKRMKNVNKKMYAYKNEWNLNFIIQRCKSTYYSTRTFQAGIVRAKGTWHRLSSKVSARLRKITHRKTVWHEIWVWSQSQHDLYMISALPYRPKITSILFTDNYKNFSTHSRLHYPTVGIHERPRCSRLWANPRSLFALTSKPAPRYLRSPIVLASKMRAPLFELISELTKGGIRAISEPPVLISTIFPYTFCGKYHFCKDQLEKKFTFHMGMSKSKLVLIGKFDCICAINTDTIIFTSHRYIRCQYWPFTSQFFSNLKKHGNFQVFEQLQPYIKFKVMKTNSDHGLMFSV